MKYLIKQAVLPFIYLFFTALTAFGILCIGNDLIWLKVVLNVLNAGLYVLIVALASYKDGQDSLKVRIANDLEREQIIRTGENRPLKLAEEYKPWKGFVIGGVACAPLVILLLIHTILIFAVGTNYVGAGAIAGFVYMIIFAFTRMNLPAVAEGVSVVVDPFMYYWTLFAIPLIVLSVGIPYILGAKKIELQQERIKAKHRSIYGDRS